MVILFYRFSIFQHILAAEKKECTILGIRLANKKEEKQPLNAEEKKFWTKGLQGKNSARSLLNIVYFYKRKSFGLRASEHRNICSNNFKLAMTINYLF